MASFDVLETGDIEQIEKALKDNKKICAKKQGNKTDVSLVKQLRGSCPDMKIDIDVMRGRT